MFGDDTNYKRKASKYCITKLESKSTFTQQESEEVVLMKGRYDFREETSPTNQI